MDYRKKIANLKENIKNTCKNVGRDPNEVCIVAATKYADAAKVQEVLDCGINHFGENRASDLVEKSENIRGKSVWHFIGHLQSRKAKLVVPIVEYIHSIDKIKTLNKIAKEAKKIKKVQKVLVEVNISGEESKYGIDEKDVIDFIKEAKEIENTEIKGFMTMAPYTDDFEFIRSIFKKLRLLKEECANKFKDISFEELSMGMSNDYKIAIEEGATMIRVGSIIFK